MLQVYTSQYSYGGPDRLDITVGGQTPFAPTWKMVLLYKEKQISQKEYTEQYIQKMRESYSIYRSQWDKLLKKDRVVLVCYCAKHRFCHRRILAKILTKLGAEYKGEIV